MALEDRDRTFEKALARHLRSARSSPDANSPAGAPAQPSVELCPDPEMLAAYHDGALSSEERNLWKQHVVSCGRCQLVLSHLATSLDIPVGLEAGKNVEALQPLTSAARTPSPARISRPSPAHTLRWLWLVPAGAIAATLVAWVSLQEKKPALVAPSPVEVAENRQAPAIAPLAKPAPAAPAENRERKESDQLRAPSVGVTGVDAADRDLASKQLQNQTQVTQQAPSQYAVNPAHGPSFTAQKQEQQIGRIAAGGAGAFDQKKKLDAPSNAAVIGGRSSGALAQQVLVPALPPPPRPLPSSEPSFIADGSVSAPLKDQERSATAPAPAPASNLTAPKAKSVSSDAISSATESLEISSAPQSPAASRAMLRAAALQNPHVFWAPGGKQGWRIGPAGSLERSKDKGLNWTPQISGVYTDLLAGFAPSAKVCWIVGTSGTILRTDDGGTHWVKLDSPVTNDLTGIRASDAAHAWISFVSDQQTGLVKTFQTNDGGATWSLLSNP
jgi:hypothetical protein